MATTKTTAAKAATAGKPKASPPGSAAMTRLAVKKVKEFEGEKLILTFDPFADRGETRWIAFVRPWPGKFNREAAQSFLAEGNASPTVDQVARRIEEWNAFPVARGVGATPEEAIAALSASGHPSLKAKAGR